MNAKHLSIIQIVQPHFTRLRVKKNIIRVEQYHLALQHYRGGHPVPRVASSYDGGLLIYANILANVGFFSLLFAYFNSIQTAKSQDLIAIDIQMGSC